MHLLEGKKRGLGAAYVRGITHAMDRLGAEVVIQMDADFSHDPADAGRLVARVAADADVAIGSRYVAGGSVDESWGFRRRQLSLWGNRLARWIAGLKGVRDCTAGFKAIRTSALRAARVEDITVLGYAFQVALLHRLLHSGARVVEEPIYFRDRERGVTKLGMDSMLEFFYHIWWLRLTSHRTFIRFSLTGLSGVFVNLGSFHLLTVLGVHRYLGLPDRDRAVDHLQLPDQQLLDLRRPRAGRRQADPRPEVQRGLAAVAGGELRHLPAAVAAAAAGGAAVAAGTGDHPRRAGQLLSQLLLDVPRGAARVGAAARPAGTAGRAVPETVMTRRPNTATGGAEQQPLPHIREGDAVDSHALPAAAPAATGPGHPRWWAEPASWPWLAPLVLCLLVLVSYLPAMLWGDLVWDDLTMIRNQAVREVSGLRQIWFAPGEIRGEGHYWPLVYSSFWLEHQLWGTAPAGYHVVNVLLHLANTLLLWRLLRSLAVPGAWLVAAVFAVHPVRVESVAWVIERKDVLSGLFYLAAATVWIRVGGAPRPGRSLAALALYAAGLLSKSVVVTLPVALLIWRWRKRGRVTAADLLRLAPFFLVGAAISAADLVFNRSRGVGGLGYSLVERALIAARAVWFYLGKNFWPMDLGIVYPALGGGSRRPAGMGGTGGRCRPRREAVVAPGQDRPRAAGRGVVLEARAQLPQDSPQGGQ